MEAGWGCISFGVVRPPKYLVYQGNYLAVGREGVVKIRDGGDVPRVAGPGAHFEAPPVVNEVGDN